MAVSELFRHPGVWQRLEPMLNGRDRVIALSAGCAMGYEAYSLAIFARHYLGLDLDQFAVHALDVDPALLETARAGRAPGAVLVAALIEGYLTPASAFASFTLHGSAPAPEARLIPEMLERIYFDVDDLNDPRHLPPAVDVAFAANLWRHLTPAGRERLAARLHTAVSPDGVLVIGGADLLGYPPDDVDAVLVERPEWTAELRRHFDPVPGTGDLVHTPKP